MQFPSSTQELAHELEVRAGYLSKAMPTVASHLAIAQHRDKLRYAMTRLGAYLPTLRKFSKGDFVYLRRTNRASTLQIAARQTILRILEIREGGSVLLQGRCGCTILNNVVNLAPCHSPNIDPTIHLELARPEALTMIGGLNQTKDTLNAHTWLQLHRRPSCPQSATGRRQSHLLAPQLIRH